MKKIITTFVILVTLATYSQQNDSQQQTVSVSGSAKIDRELTKYKAKITLNLEQAYYSNPECKTVKEFKSLYFEKLEKYGVDTSKLEENKIEFMTYGYQKGGTVFTFETALKSEIEKFTAVKLGGVSVVFSFKFEITELEQEQLVKTALKDATKNAEKVCKAIDRELGKIVSISERTPMGAVWKSYQQEYEEYTTVNVTYAMN